MIIGLDISPTSTAMYITGNPPKVFSYSTQKANNKYIKLVQSFANVEFIEYEKNSNYSINEIGKAKVYYSIANKIINDILSVTNPSETIRIIIEGHSYSSAAGHIIDVATLTGMIKAKIFDKLPKAEIQLISPITLKLSVAELVYGSHTVMEGKKKLKPKKVILTNHLNTPPNKYQKTDMLIALHDYINKGEKTAFNEFLNSGYDEIIKLKSVPKPIDDLVDAFWLAETNK